MPRWKEQHETEVAEGEATVCAVSLALNHVGGCINITAQRRRSEDAGMEGTIYFSVVRSCGGKRMMHIQQAGKGQVRERRNSSNRELWGMTEV